MLGPRLLQDCQLFWHLVGMRMAVRVVRFRELGCVHGLILKTILHPCRRRGPLPAQYTNGSFLHPACMARLFVSLVKYDLDPMTHHIPNRRGGRMGLSCSLGRAPSTPFRLAKQRPPAGAAGSAPPPPPAAAASGCMHGPSASACSARAGCHCNLKRRYGP